MRSLTLILALTCLLALPARAQELPADRYSSYTAYVLVGDQPGRGRFTCVLRMGRNLEGELTVERQVRWRESGEVERYAGVVVWRHGERIEAELYPSKSGMVCLITEDKAPVSRHMSLRLQGNKIWSQVRGPQGESLAVGKRWVGHTRSRPTTLKGRLVVLARDELHHALESGVNLRQRFKLMGVFHVGVGVGVRLLRERELSVEELEALRQRPNTVWGEVEAEGSARIPLSTRIPLGQGAWVSLGVSTGASLRYFVRERYDVPQKGARKETALADLRLAKERVFGLPLTADEALDRTLGASHAIEGEWDLAVSGQLGIGEVYQVVGDVVRVGAQARVGGFYRMRRRARMVSTRLTGNDVRLRFTTVDARERGANLNAEVGALIKVTKDDLDPAEVGLKLKDEYVQPVYDAASGALEKILRVELRANSGRVDDQELDVAYRFDLSVPTAREAYERAVRGDLTVAAEAAKENDGVSEEFRIVQLERRRFRAADLQVSELLSGGARRDVSAKDLLVTDAAGQTRFDVLRFRRHRHWRFLSSLSKSDRRMNVELSGARPAPGEVRPRPDTLTYRVELTDPHTYKYEGERLRRILNAWHLPGTTAEDLPTPEMEFLHTRFGRTRAMLDVSISRAGLEALLTSSQERLLRGYAYAVTVVEGEQVVWATAQGRKEVAESSANDDNDHLSEARSQLRRARNFVKAVRGLATAPDARSYEEHFTDLVKNDGWRLETITAILALVPLDAAHVTGELDGERLVYLGEIRGEEFSPLRRERLRGR